MNFNSKIPVQTVLAECVLGYLKSGPARQLAGGYREDPLGAATDIYAYLLSRVDGVQPRDLEKWVRVNARFLLRNYLNRERRSQPLQPPQEREK